MRRDIQNSEESIQRNGISQEHKIEKVLTDNGIQEATVN
jgi:hypothetical protein